MELVEELRERLSPVDFERMMAWLSGLPPEQRGEVMEFITARETRAPAVGEEAPDFELSRLEDGGRVRLSSFRGAKPVALIFGSFT
jgi:hypothetical protein